MQPETCADCGTALAPDDEGTLWCPRCWGHYRWPRWMRSALRSLARQLERLADMTKRPAGS